QETAPVAIIKCAGCGAQTTFPAHVSSQECPYCGNPLIAKDAQTVDLLKPKSLLPFAITQQQAQDAVSKWISGLWFAPSKLKDYAQHDNKLKGLYIPYWTFDCE